MSLFRIIFILLLTVLLSACGFSPVYQSSSYDAGMANKLATIEIEAADNLKEQVFVNKLQDLLNPTSISVPAKYRIKAVIDTGQIPLAIQQDRTITRYKTTATVQYTITDLATGKVIDKSFIKREGEYDKVESDYATYVSENNSKNRIIKELAEDAKIRIMSIMLKQ